MTNLQKMELKEKSIFGENINDAAQRIAKQIYSGKKPDERDTDIVDTGDHEITREGKFTRFRDKDGAKKRLVWSKDEHDVIGIQKFIQDPESGIANKGTWEPVY